MSQKRLTDHFKCSSSSSDEYGYKVQVATFIYRFGVLLILSIDIHQAIGLTMKSARERKMFSIKSGKRPDPPTQSSFRISVPCMARSISSLSGVLKFSTWTTEWKFLPSHNDQSRSCVLTAISESSCSVASVAPHAQIYFDIPCVLDKSQPIDGRCGSLARLA